MTSIKLIYPALVQILWTFVVLGIMFQRRRAALVSKEVRIADIAVSTDRFPDNAKLAAANFSNQFETPVIFFALIMLAMEVNATGYVMAALAWGFVATRIVHTLIHTGANPVKSRAAVFALGVVCLFCMWVGVVVTVI